MRASGAERGGGADHVRGQGVRQQQAGRRGDRGVPQGPALALRHHLDFIRANIIERRCRRVGMSQDVTVDRRARTVRDCPVGTYPYRRTGPGISSDRGRGASHGLGRGDPFGHPFGPDPSPDRGGPCHPGTPDRAARGACP